MGSLWFGSLLVKNLMIFIFFIIDKFKYIVQKIV